MGVMEREQGMVMVTEGRVGGDGEVTGDGDGDRGKSGW